MEHGAVVELGSPKELLDQNGAFSALVESERAGQEVA
jgi:ABC-type multidrug transport system fused ATPase/permease subunit